MNAPKKQKPQAEEQAAQRPADTSAATDPVNSAPQAPAGEPGVTVRGAVESRPDDAHPGEAVVVPGEAQFEATALQGNARALRRVEHDGKVYGPGEPAGDVLGLSAEHLASLESIGAVERL